LETHNPDVFVFFEGALADIERRLRIYASKRRADAEVKQEDACQCH
jgi:hypothetical protein